MIERENLYPLLFDPIYKEVMWGGKMMSSLDRELPETKMPIGEAWDLVDRTDEVSQVSNGPLAGTPLNKLVQYYGKSLIGSKYEGGPFPLLVKIIDAEKKLSLQVHPDPAACAELGNNAQPKTEMWYIIKTKGNAKIIGGLKPNSTRNQFVEKLNSPDVEDCLQVFTSHPGDAYFIQSGRVHAIGGGNLLLEIQQNSDTTYRISDWGRVDSDGNPRELHVEQAMKSIDFMDRTAPIITGVSDSVTHNRKFPTINKCPYFQVDDLRLVNEWRDNTEQTSSFHLITAINHPVKVGRGDRVAVVKKGMTCLIPANFGSYTIDLETNQETTVIRTTL